MSRIYLPNSNQFKRINEHLKTIASVVGAKIDISTWSGIQRAVRAGVAPQVLPIGTRLDINNNIYSTDSYYVVAHDYFKSVHDETAHTMTLLCISTYDLTMPFDSPEAFYYAEDGLSAGVYSFKLESKVLSLAAGVYNFRLTADVPAGGILCLSSNGSNVVAYNDRYDAPAFYTSVVSGEAGTSLGTFGKELNYGQRVSSGSNNYKESAIRQFLNSSAEVGSVWTPQTKYDRPPSWHSTHDGFMRGLDEDFLAVIGEVIVPCAANKTYESPDSTTVKGEKYTVTDKFYLPSQAEIFGTYSGAIADDSVQFPYCEGATNIDRVREDIWWLRSANSWSSNTAAVVDSSGALSNRNSSNSYLCIPACTIV